MQTRFPNKILPYLLLSPSVIVVLIFFVVPSAQSIYASFFRSNISGTRQIFVGLRNFEQLFTTSEYLNSLQVTLLFALFVVVVGLSLSLFIAMVANQRLRGFTIYRTLLIWPYALSPNIAGTIWALMLEPTIGMATNAINTLGLHFDWRGNATHALLFIALAATWKMLGYNIIFFLAGIQGLPTEILEAGSVDGANAWTKFWKITFPLLSPTTFFLLIMNTLYAFFEGFGLIHVTTNGGPGYATDLLVYKLYRDGFIAMNTGFASAQSVVLLFIVASLTLLQFRYAGRRVFYGA
ncbi:MAG: sugar ABC transporter permease [Chloroflexi bacterium]|nr:sugar ABC transporter permease [Chloroflexota bacterium]